VCSKDDTVSLNLPHCTMSTNFDVDSSSHFLFRAWTDRQNNKVRDTTIQPTYVSTNAGVDNNHGPVCLTESTAVSPVGGLPRAT